MTDTANQTHWSVRLAAPIADYPTDDELEVLYDKLQRFSPAIGADARGQLEFQMTITAPSLKQAAMDARGAANWACRDALEGLEPEWVEMEVLRWATFEAQVDSDTVTVRLPREHWVQIVDDIENMCGTSAREIEILRDAKVVG